MSRVTPDVTCYIDVVGLVAMCYTGRQVFVLFGCHVLYQCWRIGHNVLCTLYRVFGFRLTVHTDIY